MRRDFSEQNRFRFPAKLCSPRHSTRRYDRRRAPAARRSPGARELDEGSIPYVHLSVRRAPATAAWHLRRLRSLPGPDRRRPDHVAARSARLFSRAHPPPGRLGRTQVWGESEPESPRPGEGARPGVGESPAERAELPGGRLEAVPARLPGPGRRIHPSLAARASAARSCVSSPPVGGAPALDDDIKAAMRRIRGARRGGARPRGRTFHQTDARRSAGGSARF
jgi:hypothetical protein